MLSRKIQHLAAFVMQTHPARFAGPPELQEFCNNWAPKIWTHAQSRGVPMMSAERLLAFMEARAQATFANMSWDNGSVTFDLRVPVAGQALTIMLPGTQLESVHVDGRAAPFEVERLMGRDYALITITAAAARVVAMYSAT